MFLVKEGLLPRHEARELAAMERIAFEELLAHRQVAEEPTVEVIFADVEAAERILGT